MGRQRRNSKTLDDVYARINGMTAIDKDLGFGEELTLAKFKQMADEHNGDLDAYNQQLARLDEQANELNAAEKRLRDYSERMLAAVGARWGKDSNQYEQAGGTRKSERKRKTTAPKTQPNTH
jgi:septal ring factor EnvC (AmiA/AmiB activator)